MNSIDVLEIYLAWSLGWDAFCGVTRIIGRRRALQGRGGGVEVGLNNALSAGGGVRGMDEVEGGVSFYLLAYYCNSMANAYSMQFVTQTMKGAVVNGL